jgi:hypothetical protein
MHHVQRFPASDLTDDDPSRPLAKRSTLEEILKGDAPSALNIGITFFETEEVRFAELVKPQFRLRFEDAGTLSFRHSQRKDSSKCCLARSCRPANDGIETSTDSGLEDGNCLSRDGALPFQVPQQEKPPKLLLPDGNH